MRIGSCTIQETNFYFDPLDGIVKKVANFKDLRHPHITIYENGWLRYRGAWAPTSAWVTFETVLTYHPDGAFGPNGDLYPTPSSYPSIEETVAAVQASAAAYKAFSENYEPITHRGMLSGQLKYSEPAYAGYAQNAIALFLIGIAGRGLFGTRRWWHGMRGKFRSKKNRCVVCGYNLRGLTRGRCPECGVLIPDRHSEIYTSREDVPERDHFG